MDLNYFKKIRILDGGMGQELLAKGLISKGTLWSTSALLDDKFHQLLIDVHTSFINAGADVIVTNNFSSRKVRLFQNKVEDKFEFVNKKACELANKAREISKELPQAVKNVVDAEDQEVAIEREVDRITQSVAPKVKSLICIDPSNALAIAKKNLSNFDNCEFYSATVDEIPMEDNSTVSYTHLTLPTNREV